MPSKTRDLLDALKRNACLRHYPVRTAYEPFDRPTAIVDAFLGELATINADAHLTPEGKAAARKKAAAAATDTIKGWETTRLAGLDGDLRAQRTALLPAGDRPDPRQVDAMLSRLQSFSPTQVAILYRSATDAEKRAIEAASAAGRTPTKTTDGGVAWTSLLSPEVVSESTLERAQAQNPAAVERLRELEDLRAQHATVAAHAAQEIREALG